MGEFFLTMNRALFGSICCSFFPFIFTHLSFQFPKAILDVEDWLKHWTFQHGDESIEVSANLSVVPEILGLTHLGLHLLQELEGGSGLAGNWHSHIYENPAKTKTGQKLLLGSSTWADRCPWCCFSSLLLSGFLVHRAPLLLLHCRLL